MRRFAVVPEPRTGRSAGIAIQTLRQMARGLGLPIGSIIVPCCGLYVVLYSYVYIYIYIYIYIYRVDPIRSFQEGTTKEPIGIYGLPEVKVQGFRAYSLGFRV